jgi:hypothetical protein
MAFIGTQGFGGSGGSGLGIDRRAPAANGFSSAFNARNQALAGTHKYAGGSTPFYSGIDSAAGVKGYIDKYNATPRDEYGGLAGGNAVGPHRVGDYMFSQTQDGRYYAVNTKDKSYGTGRTKGDIYDASGKYLGSDYFDTEKGALGKMWDAAIPLLTTAMIGGGVAGGFGVGPFAGGGAGSAGAGGIGAAAGDAGLMYAGADAAAAGSLGGGYMGGLGGVAGGAGGLGAAAAAGGAGAGGGGFSLGGLLGGSGGGGGLSLGNILKGGQALGGLLGGGGGSGGGGLQDLLSIIGGGVDAQRQGDAAKTMMDWLKTNQGKMEGYMNPNSPEYKAMWEEMSRKDAAAGRNSQYGPRTADFLANVAKAKADNIRSFTTGTSRAYADALNQNAGKYAGLSAGLGRALQGGGTTNMTSLIGMLTGGGYNASTGGGELGEGVLSGVDAWDDAWLDALDGEDFIDYGQFF